MSFNICPFNSYVQKKILPFAGDRGRRSRTPLAVRAQAALQSQSIMLPLVARLSDRAAFRVRGCKFTIANESKTCTRHFISLLISHLGSIFNEGKVQVRIKDKSPTELIVFIKAFDPGQKKTLALEFSIHHDNYLALKWIISHKPGLGGKMLAALYNLAKDLRIHEIFYVPKDEDAEAFYFHMDYVSRITGSIFWLRI